MNKVEFVIAWVQRTIRLDSNIKKAHSLSQLLEDWRYLAANRWQSAMVRRRVVGAWDRKSGKRRLILKALHPRGEVTAIEDREMMIFGMVDSGMVEVRIGSYWHQELGMTCRMDYVGLVHFSFNLEEYAQGLIRDISRSDICFAQRGRLKEQ